MGIKHVNEKLRCAKCKKDGTAKWEANDQRGGPQRKLVGLTDGFKSVDKGGREGIVITCAACGSRVS